MGELIMENLDKNTNGEEIEEKKSFSESVKGFFKKCKSGLRNFFFNEDGSFRPFNTFKDKDGRIKTKKIIKISVLSLVIAILGSTILQFGYNMLFVTPEVYETTKGGDGKLTDMLYQSEFLEDSYFADAALISANLEGAIERIDIREDCADFTACGLIRFYLENEHRLMDENKEEIKKCLTGFK